MTERELRERFKDWVFRGSAYRMALSVVGFDRNTAAPKGGAEYREKRTAFLGGELFGILADPGMEPVLRGMMDLPDPAGSGDEAAAEGGAEGLAMAEFSVEELRRMASLCYKEYAESKAVPKEMFVAWQGLLGAAYRKWLEAKTQNDYSILAPYLQQVIDKAREVIRYTASAGPDRAGEASAGPQDLSCYELMLRKNEPGMTLEKYDAFFGLVKERLLPLIRRIRALPPVDDSFLFGHFDLDKQRAFSKLLLSHLGFTPDWGIQGETEHPVTIWVAANDVRTTTHFREESLMSAIFSTIHECGHAWYAHDVDPRYEGTALLGGISAAMHESQSRLLENHIGRSAAFWAPLYPRLQEFFPEALGAISFDRFMKAVNRVRPTLVRTQADELTYPVHILIRYELEKDLFAGRLSAEELPAAWAEKYRDYLGITPENDRDGVLQDMHWAAGYHGYFPTYALGSAIAAQIDQRMREEVDVDGLLRESRVPEVMAWLREHVHRFGALYDTDELLRRACGADFDPSCYVKYLEEKSRHLFDP